MHSRTTAVTDNFKQKRSRTIISNAVTDNSLQSRTILNNATKENYKACSQGHLQTSKNKKDHYKHSHQDNCKQSSQGQL